MKVWCSLDGDGRPEQVFLEDIGSPDLTESETPEGVAPEQLGDYMWDGSKWVYDRAATAPTHAENAFDKGERCHHPGADGDIWVSGREGNTSEPGTDEWWTREGDATDWS